MYFFYYDDPEPARPSVGQQLRSDLAELLAACSLVAAAIILWDLW